MPKSAENQGLAVAWHLPFLPLEQAFLQLEGEMA